MNSQVTLIGNMGKNLRVFNTQNGGKVARFNMVTTSTEEDGVKFKWHDLFCFGNLAQFIEDFGEKGKRICVTGKQVDRTFINHNGETKKVAEIEVRSVIGL